MPLYLGIPLAIAISGLAGIVLVLFGGIGLAVIKELMGW